MDALAERDIDQGVVLHARVRFLDCRRYCFPISYGSKIRPGALKIAVGQKQGTRFPRGPSYAFFVTATLRFRQIFDCAELDQRKTQLQASLHQPRLEQLWILL